MPITPTYPGVYIEEIPSGVRTITGVATSITAFIGRAMRGPTNEPVTINSFSDFERVFGGLWLDSALGYALRDFYLNGGSQAIVVRLFHPFFASGDRALALAAAQAVATAATDAAALGGADAASVNKATQDEADKYTAAGPSKTAAEAVAKAAETAKNLTGATAVTVKNAAVAAVGAAAPVTKAGLSVGSLNLEAASEGEWGNQLRFRLTTDVPPAAAARFGLAASDMFNLLIRDGGTGVIESINNLTFKDSPRRVDRVLQNESNLVRFNGTPTGSESVPAAHGDPAAGKTVWDDDSASAKVANTDQASNGAALTQNDFTGSGQESNKQGLFALEKTDLFNLLCLPPYLSTNDVDSGLLGQAAAYCERRRAFLIVDSPSNWKKKDDAKNGLSSLGVSSNHAAVFFPRLLQPNQLRDNQVEEFVPCGTVAGVFARTDATRGVWKAPAGIDASLVGVPQLRVPLTDAENGELNPLGLNCLRAFPVYGRVIWGARTLQGDDRFASEWKYIPVRRTALFIEESLYRGTQWVVFEPNDEPLWAQIRLNIGAFMHNLFRQGAFQGKTPREAYLVKCDKETTTQNDINLGIVNILVGFAPLKPAEFVIIKIQQLAGEIAT